MARIYSSACLNVSATRSSDGLDGLLGGSGWSHSLPTKVELPDGLSFYVVNGDLWDDEIDDGALLKRGWVFQERCLARRIVHFGESQLGWECLESRRLEVFPEGLPPSMGISDHKTSVLSWKSTGAATDPGIRFMEDWHERIEEYSKCRLTYPADKLIALQGIADAIKMARPDDVYAAGMWKSIAVFGLPWRRSNSDADAYPIDKTSHRAPSWSWASVDGAISFPSINAVSRVQEVYAQVEQLKSRATYRDGRILDNGEIRIQGVCFPLKVQWDQDEDIGSFMIQGFCFHRTDGPQSQSIYLEASRKSITPVSDSGKLLFMPLFATTHSLFGIMLISTRGVGAHRRVGSVEITLMEDKHLSPADQVDKNLFISPESVPTVFQTPKGDAPVRVWHRPALNLLYSIRDSKAFPRRITVF